MNGLYNPPSPTTAVSHCVANVAIADASLASTMPLFMSTFGNTLDGLGEPPVDGEAPSVVESVKEFVVMFMVIGAVSGISGFAMVFLWSVAGERQVRACM